MKYKTLLGIMGILLIFSAFLNFSLMSTVKDLRGDNNINTLKTNYFFVSFSFLDKDGNSGYGNDTITHVSPHGEFGEKDLEDFKTWALNKKNCQNMIILNYQKLDYNTNL